MLIGLKDHFCSEHLGFAFEGKTGAGWEKCPLPTWFCACFATSFSKNKQMKGLMAQAPRTDVALLSPSGTGSEGLNQLMIFCKLSLYSFYQILLLCQANLVCCHWTAEPLMLASSCFLRFWSHTSPESPSRVSPESFEFPATWGFAGSTAPGRHGNHVWWELPN